MVNGLDDLFPGLRREGYRITSPHTPRYNCIAWAAGDNLRWWWPDLDPRFFWPESAVREETLAAFEQAFITLGYMTCPDEETELGFEKIALFADAEGFPTHAARQLETGLWTSKLGELEDIEHALHDLEGAAYGRAVRYMKRSRAAPTPDMPTKGETEGATA